jgi:L-iditol 2-dehydrogenase
VKALVKTEPGPGNLELRDVPEPFPGQLQVKIRVVYSGICGTDIHTWEGRYPGNKPPVTLGHEFSGYVTETGPGVSLVKTGDRVVSETTFETCGHCPFCIEEEYNLCQERKGLGTQVNGSFAEYVIAREKSVHLLPPRVSLLSGALCEPLACCVHGCLERGAVSKGDTVLVMGPGAMGLLCSLVALSQGARVVLAGMSHDGERLALARELGVQRTVVVDQEDLKGIVLEMTGGRGSSPVFECSGSLRALNTALDIAAKKADVVEMGVFSRRYNELDTSVFFSKEIRLVGSRTSKPSSWRTAIQLMADGTVVPEKIVTATVDLEDWLSGFTAVKECRGIKTVIQSGKALFDI